MDFSTFFTVKDLIFIAFGEASGRPPLLVMITAHPQLDASKAVLPKGSYHLEQTTLISETSKYLDTILCF